MNRAENTSEHQAVATADEMQTDALAALAGQPSGGFITDSEEYHLIGEMTWTKGSMPQCRIADPRQHERYAALIAENEEWSGAEGALLAASLLSLPLHVGYKNHSSAQLRFFDNHFIPGIPFCVAFFRQIVEGHVNESHVERERQRWL
jgi:hypothetical protein